MKSTRIVIISAIITLLQLSAVQADFVGLNIGASHWLPNLSGSFNSTNSANIDVDNDLGLDKKSDPALTIVFEHPIPALPNIKYQGYRLNSSGATVLTSDLTFNGQKFTSGGQINSTVDLSHDDIVLYYALVDNWINLDLGVDLKRFSGAVELNGTSSTRIEVDETIPLLYLSARFDLPYSGFYIGADLNNFSINKNSIQDSTVKLGYKSSYGLGLEGGIKNFLLKLDDANNLDTDIKYNGIFLNGYYNF